VSEVPTDAPHGVVFERGIVRLDVAVAQVGQSRLVTRDRRLAGGGFDAVVTEERHNVCAGGQRDQPLREPHEQIIDLVGLGLGDAANRESPLLPLVLEEDPVAAVMILEGCYGACLSGNATG
jgi:hypothetical protein